MLRKKRRTILAATALLVAAAGSAQAVDKVMCIPWEGDPAKQHTAIAGTAAQLSCVVKTDSTAQRWYKWVWGDGSADSGKLSLSGSTKYNVDTTHVYNAAVGTPFAAQLQVATNPDVVTPVSGSYLLKIEDNQPTYADNSLDARINIAIDKGLWWLYKNANNGGSTFDSSPFMSWYESSSWASVYAAPTASAIQAFAINNHKVTGDPDVDPYAEAVKLGMNFLMKGSPALTAVHLGPNSYDPNSTQYGVKTASQNHQIYEGGQVMDAIIASGVQPGDLTGRSFDNSGNIWSYKQVLQSMADMYIQNQNRSYGGWGEWDFGSGEHDNSSSQWAAIGLLPAQAAPWNVIVPDSVKTLNKSWLNYSYCNAANGSGYFIYQNACYCEDGCLNTTPCGLVQMNFDGYTSDNAKWIGASKFIADNWWALLQNGSQWGNSRTYGMYSMAKAMRLALPNPVEQITKSNGHSFDWYRGGADYSNDGNFDKGLAVRLLEMQNSDGYWIGNLTSPTLATAWMVITLRPTLFAAAPTACFSANPNPTYSNADVTLDPSCSGHSETGKNIGNLTRFQWDWDNDGIFDSETGTPSQQTHQFYCKTPPCTFPVKLKVTDDNNPPLTATAVVDVKITNPPHPPVANAGGPYVASLCSGDTLVLDGSNSFHPDLGLFEAGCTTCVGAKIVKYDWDLRTPYTFDVVDAASTDPVKSATVIPAGIFAAGTDTIALRVTDNAISGPAFPKSGLQADQTGTAFGTINVKSGCLCSLVAAAKDRAVQLNWSAGEHSASTSYDIYRSTVGPNTGFTKIRSGYQNAYPLFVDSGLTNGVKYYYRVDKLNPAGAPCESRAVSAVPKLPVR